MICWTGLAKTLHWTMAILLPGMAVFGLMMTAAADTAAATGTYDLRIAGLSLYDAYQAHKSVGMLLLCLAAVRLAWRITNPAPPVPKHMPGIERHAARAVHVALYVLMFSIPVSGWLLASASPLDIPTEVFGVIRIPRLIAADAVLEGWLSWVHWGTALVLMGLVGLHALAALKHHLIDKDEVLLAMLPRGRRN